MSKVTVYNLKGEKAGDVSLSKDVFDLPNNDALLHQAYVTISANRRQSTSHTKGVGERAGSGIKPWRQKGTGRARTGSVRNPIWRKGGVTFGPKKERNFKKNITKKMNQKAIKLALSGKVREKKLFVIDKMELPEKKTKQFALALEKIGISKSALIGFTKEEKDLHLYCRNIKKISSIPTDNLNVLDILNNDSLIVSKESIKVLEEKYAK